MSIDNDKTVGNIPESDSGGARSSIGSTPTVKGGFTVRRFRVGEVVLGRYKITGELGQGGMGVVYRCFDEVGGIDVALKALPPELSHNTGEMEEVRENFRLVSRLSHPNIAQVRTLEKDSATGNYYLIMECVDGVNLRKYRKQKGGKLTIAEVIPLIRQAAAALDYAHSEKIIHRDIKPSNIMVSASGRVKVLDFGLAAQLRSSLSRVSRAGFGTSGTGPYMAPEQWRGREQTAATDQYALAVTCYELLSGRCPFESHDATVLREVVLNEPPPRIPGMEPGQWEVIRRALSKDRNERFLSCAEFARALKEGRIGKRKKRGRKKAERRMIWGVVALLLLAVAGYGAWYGIGKWRGSRQRERQEQILSRENQKKLAELKQQARLALAKGYLKTAGAKLAEAEEMDKSDRGVLELRRELEGKASAREMRDRYGEAKQGRKSLAAMDLDRGQGFAEDLNDLEADWTSAQSAKDAEEWGEALGKYDRVLAGVRRIKDLEKKRNTARTARKTSEAKRREAEGAEAEQLAAESYNAAAGFCQEAEGLFEGGDFQQSRQKWKKAVPKFSLSATRARNITDYREAKEKYSKEVKPHQKLLEDSDEDLWRKVKAKTETAKESEDDPVYGAGLYQQALDMLPKAVEEARKAKQGTDYRTALEQANRFVEQKAWKKAEAAVREALRSGWVETAAATALLARTEKHLGPKPGDEITVDLGGGEKLELVWIPPGSFEMGSNSGDSDEKPIHTVNIKDGFWLGKYEVTNGQYLAFLNAGGESGGVDWDDDDCPLKKSGGRYRLSGNKFGNNKNQPMVEVSWKGANAFCRWVERKAKSDNKLPENYTVTLPSESQWEYACRADSKSAYYWGDSPSGDYANGDEAEGWPDDGYKKKTAPVKSFKPNDFGLYDMSGNVWEWCEDYWHDDYQGAPKDGTPWLAGGNKSRRVLRGGSWRGPPGNLRSANRGRNAPTPPYDLIGFRIAWTQK